jgi:hypothetical protein
LDAEARSVRDDPRKAIDGAGNLSIPLRVIGDFLDQKEAVNFSMSWSIYSVRVEYENTHEGRKQEDFTLQNLYDRGVKMYFRRSKSE